ncbi:transforming growth factor-beta-induced protein ig-h3-like [Babylonia areolata]|uniref:transforming growth factor-beta-induced protein ig-h3-like n=1 Tax=Babylonia areolata TaxID=304850 RepID=UPI003FD03054
MAGTSRYQRPPSVLTMARVLEEHSLSGLFEEDNITVFLPTSDAYFRFQYEAETSFRLDYNNPSHLRELLLYSSVRGRYMMSDLPQATTGTLPSRLDPQRPLFFNQLRTNVGKVSTINGARFVKTNLVSDNGIVHVVSRVVAPVAHNSTLATYVEKPALKQFAFTSIYFARAVVPNLTLETNRTDRWFTSFSPNDSYITVMPDYGQTPLFEDWALLRLVYKAHVVKGNALFIPEGAVLKDEESLHGTLKFSRHKNDVYVSNGRVRARVVQANIPVLNGVLHVIDNLLYYVYRDVVQMVTSLPNTRTMGKWISQLPEVARTLNGSERQFTVLVPTDDAFAKLPDNVRSRLASDPLFLGEMEQVVKNHVMTDVTYDVDALSQQTKVMNMNGTDIRIKKYGDELYLEWGGLRARVVTRDLGVTNGIVHLIDTVLFPTNFTVWEAMTNLPELSGIQEVMQEFQDVVDRMSDEDGHVTVFLPRERAMSRASHLLDDWLDTARGRVHNATLGHISAGSFSPHLFSSPTTLTTLAGTLLTLTQDEESKDIYVQGSHVKAKVTVQNVWCINGVIFIIDEILHLPTRTIAEELSRRPELKYMTTLFSGFVDEPYNFSDPSSYFTLFVANNDAFSYLPWPSIDRLLRESDRTKMILRAHIVRNERRYLSGIPDEEGLPAIQNVIYLLTKDGRRYAINNNLWAEVVTPDIPAVNGHVHIINRLLYIPYHTVSQLLHTMEELRPFHDLMSEYVEYKVAVEAEDRNVTFFIPSSRYLRTVTSKQMRSMKADPKVLKRLYQGHTLPQVRMDDVFLSQFPDQDIESKSSFNVSFQISRSHTGVFVDGGYDRQILDVVGRAYGCTNGIIYVIDGFLNYSPLTILERLKREPTVSRSLQHMILLPPPSDAELLNARNMTFTFLMPDDPAMDHLTSDDINNLHKLSVTERQEIFWRHVLNGSEIIYDDLRHGHFDSSILPAGVTVTTVNGGVYFLFRTIRSRIARQNLVACNGVIHLLTHYLYPPPRPPGPSTLSPLHTPNPLPTPTSVKGDGTSGAAAASAQG